MLRTAWTMFSCGLLLASITNCAGSKPGVRTGQQADSLRKTASVEPGVPPPLPAEPVPKRDSSERAAGSGLKAPESPAAVTSGAAKLGFDLLERLARKDASQNVFISPVSIALALGMTWNGAAGSTEQAMGKVLGLPDASREAVNLGYGRLVRDLRSSDTAFRLEIANSLWLRKGIPFLPDFLQANRRTFAAEIGNLDFDAPSAVGQINDWVSRNTQGKITRIIDQIGKLDIAFLINAVYFKGRWSRVFDRRANGPFTLASGEVLQAPMMSQTGQYLHLRGPGFEAAAIPYGSGRVRMYAFLPDLGVSIDSLVTELKHRSWDSWRQEFGNERGSITMPVFRFEYEAKLNDALSALGMAVAFDPNRADFSRMCRALAPPFISEVIHKTYVEVNEKGTEAAAATSVRVMTTAIPPRSQFSLILDRPFLVAISDSDAQALLFLGAIRNPQAEQ